VPAARRPAFAKASAGARLGLPTGEAGIKISTESVEVVRCPSMLNSNQTPRRFGRPKSGLDTTGASDHLPVGVGVQFMRKG
jgi:hypothetical protein